MCNVRVQGLVQYFIEREYDSSYHRTNFVQNAKTIVRAMYLTNISLVNAPKDDSCLGFCDIIDDPKFLVRRL